MAQGGGFCEKHGPFDPPLTVCPYCALEDAERRAYGRPAGAPPVPPDRAAANSATRRYEDMPPDLPDHDLEPDDEDERDRRGGLTEVAPREDPAMLEPEPPAPPGPIGWLIVKEPVERRGMILPLAANQVIGREGDVTWDDPRLSRQHARITLEPSEDADDAAPVFHLWPFGPANPVFINDKEVRGATPLHENDEIRLGSTLLVFKVLMD